MITEPAITKSVEWSSPSNIALIKYWGKHGNQLPANPSLSMTLRNSFSRSRISVSRTWNKPKTEFLFEGKPAPGFEPKIEEFLKKVISFFPFLKEHDLKIESWNTFPHSAGIASSASAMSALSLCLCDISGDLSSGHEDKSDFFRKASEISRLGSGSAARSVYGGYNVWGKTQSMQNTSDEWASPLDFEVHPEFAELQDSILIVSTRKKKISSTAGHQLMNSHPYAKQRYLQAEINLKNMLIALRAGNVADFIRITENEALGLHGLMMSSDPGFMLIESGSINIIDKIRDFRERTGKFVCFTIDAGPNIHLLYPASVKNEIKDFITAELIPYCENGKVIWDETGNGPVKIF